MQLSNIVVHYTDVEKFNQKKIPINYVIKQIESLPLDTKTINELQKHLLESFRRDLMVVKKTQFQPNLLKTRTVKRKAPHIFNAIQEFEAFFKHKYAETTLTRHRRSLKKFIIFLTSSARLPLQEINLMELSALTQQDLIDYESYLISEMHNHNIQKCTITKYLRTVELLIQLLKRMQLSKLQYNIPKSLMDNGKRSNVLAATEEIAAILEALDQISLYKERDLAIILLTMELGCRPIELVGITLEDVVWTESKVSLFCIKSGQRTLKISKPLTQLLKKYKIIRDTYNLTHNFLFVNQFGEQMSRNGVASIFGRANLKAFGERRINPKAMRHTYATNALDNLNDFDEVSKSLGHLHWSSTEYYVYKSISRLLKMALPYNPAEEINKSGGSYGI